ncbi:hypothetical protein [Pseudomonas sp. TMP25]|uniref:hypothetical protein n=1 Tax=Pseudomonas sp. TMP25 TaxID=3136561 RepID=UPI0031013F06
MPSPVRIRSVAGTPVSSAAAREVLHMDAVLEQVRLWAILSGRVCVQSGVVV